MIDFNPINSTNFQNNAASLNQHNIYNESYGVVQAIDPEIYHAGALAHLKEMLDILENKEYIYNNYIYREYRNNEEISRNFTTKEVLLELLDQTLMNSIEAMYKKWKMSNYIGSQVSINSFTKEGNLWIQIIDNGNGFSENVLSKIGNESLSNRDKKTSNDLYFNDALSDHLFKTGQLAQILGWELIAENNKFTGGASVSLVLPLPKVL